MTTGDRTTTAERSGPDLVAEVVDLRTRLAEAEALVHAIRSGDVDAVVGTEGRGDRVYTLTGADRLYRHLVEAMGEGAATVSASGVILYANACLAQMLGRPLERVLGTTLRDHVAPADHQTLVSAPAQAGAAPSRWEVNLVTGDGRQVPAFLSASRLQSEGGEWVTLYVLTDLTEHKSHERVIAAERLARSILEQAAEAIIVCDQRGLVTRASLAAMSLCDGSPLLLHFGEAFPLRLGEAHPFLLEPVLRGETVRDVDVVMDRGGRQVSLILNAGPLTTGQELLGCVVTLTDITERRRAEAERERLTMAIEQTGEMVVVTDVQGRITYVNPAFETVTGFGRNEVLGRNPRLLRSGKQDGEFYRGLWTTITSGHVWNGRMVNRKQDGTLYTEAATISPVRDAAGRITSYVAVKRDVTKMLAQGAQLLQAQKMEGIGRLAGGVAHDFNNLLSVMLSYTEFALEGLLEGDPRREDILEVKKGAERAAALTRQLLAFSRMQVLQPVVLSLNQVAAGLEKMLRRIIGEDIDYVQRLGPDAGLVLADPGQVEQVLLNLVVNARDAMPEGGALTIETANVEVDAEYAALHLAVKPGPYVQLTITDSGVGMDRQTLARVFEPFFTTKTRDRGTGLGLSTVYGIVKQSAGNIWVYSEPGRGTTFKIYLPRVPSASLSMVAVRGAAPMRITGSETILVVEDEDALLKVARRALKSAGYTVLTAGDGEQAMQALARHVGEVQLLLTDVIMPRMGGRELALAVQAMRPSIKVLYMSGYTDEAIVHHGVLEAGINFLAKPFVAADLLGKVRRVLDGDDPAPSLPAPGPTEDAAAPGRSCSN
jgi:PAS domain S-box-containing protein